MKRYTIAILTMISLIVFILVLIYGGNNKNEKGVNHEKQKNEQVKAADFFSKPVFKIKGEIVKVQPSSFSYYTNFNGPTISSTHEIEYVLVKTPDRGIIQFIYPRSFGIIEGDAVISYRQLSKLSINSEEFITIFLGPEFFTNDNITLHAIGIIDDLGIYYYYK